MDHESLDRVRDEVRRRPSDVEAWYTLAAVALDEGAHDEAKIALERVSELAPDHIDALRALATLLARLGDAKGSTAVWRRVVALTGPDDFEATTALAVALSTEGHHAEAIRILSNVAARRGDSAAHADLGMALLAARRLDEALAAFSRARELDPQSGQAHCGLGLVYQQQGRWWEAAEAFRLTETLAPDDPVGPMNLGVALETLGELEEAREALLRAAALAPDDPEIRQALDQLAIPEQVQTEVTRPRPTLRGDEFDAAISGNLKTFKLLEVLEFLRMQSKSGQLMVSSRKGAGTVRVVRGQITSAAATGVKRLGESLVEQGVISAKTLEAALVRQEANREEALGGLLLRIGAVDVPQLSAGVLKQILAALGEMLSWSEGGFSFRAGDDEEPPPISFSVQEVALQMAKLDDERNRRPSRHPVR